MIGESDGDDLESFFTKTFTWIDDHVDDLRDRLDRFFDVSEGARPWREQDAST